MTHEQKVAELKALLEGIAGAGIVHNRTRLVTDWGKYIENFRDGKVINGWEISRKAPLQVSEIDVVETFVFRHVRGLNDAAASDLGFQEQLNNVVRLFRDTTQLSFGAIAIGITFDVIEERMFGGVLCHYAEGELQVTEDYDSF